MDEIGLICGVCQLTGTQLIETQEIALDGLLHLATLTVALHLGFLGLDRVHGQHSEHSLDKQIERVRASLQDLLQQLEGILNQNATIRFAFEFEGVYFICYVAERTLPLEEPPPRRRFGRWLRNAWKFPGVHIFRKRIEIRIVSWLAVLSISFFFLLTAATVWDWHWVRQPAVVRFLFVWFTGCFMIALLTIVGSYHARGIERHCQRIVDTINERLELVLSQALKVLEPLVGRPAPRPRSADSPDGEEDLE